jgi:TatD DNase family protein
MMIDTHAHISKRFCDTAEEVLTKIKDEKMKVILAASNIEDSEDNIAITKENKNIIFAALGIHPQNTDPESSLSIKEQLDTLGDLAKNNLNNIVAIGECGLDYSPAPPEDADRSKDEQEVLFRGQIDLAIKYKLPLIIHARKAVDEVIEILKEYKNLSGVFHCYSGGKKRIQKILELGENWFFGIDGNLTYEDGLVEIVKLIPKDRLLLETDSPYLTPVPYRGQINNPTNVKYIYQKVAEIWDKNFNDTEKVIDSNANRLFKLV